VDILERDKHPFIGGNVHSGDTGQDRYSFRRRYRRPVRSRLLKRSKRQREHDIRMDAT
jgi:hypothetical protein